jgi:hypothetical protein
MHAATSKVENSAQGSSLKLKFVHVQDLFVFVSFFLATIFSPGACAGGGTQTLDLVMIRQVL